MVPLSSMSLCSKFGCHLWHPLVDRPILSPLFHCISIYWNYDYPPSPSWNVPSSIKHGQNFWLEIGLLPLNSYISLSLSYNISHMKYRQDVVVKWKQHLDLEHEGQDSHSSCHLLDLWPLASNITLTGIVLRIPLANIWRNM